MPRMKPLFLVPVDGIPKEVKDCPTDDLPALYKICQEMQKVCQHHQGVGLAAVQVGIPWRLCLVKARGTNNGCRYLVNCEYRPVTEEKTKGVEGCLSLNNRDGTMRHFEVERYNQIRLAGFEFTDEVELKVVPVDSILGGWEAIVVQHELDHAGWPGPPLKKQTLISEIGVELDIWPLSH